MPRSSKLLPSDELAYRDAWARERLDVLEAEYVGCTRCRALVSPGDWWRRNNVVFGEGYANADILILGIAPGADEDIAGVPFVGPTGQLLDEMLMTLCTHLEKLDRFRKGRLEVEDYREIRSVLIEAERLFYTNVALCRPVKQEWNEREEVNELRNRDPSAGECGNCSMRLLETIYDTDPIIILSLGGPTLQALLSLDVSRGARKAGVLDKAGEILDLEIPGQITNIRYPVMVLPHPAFLLRYWDEKDPRGYVQTTIRALRRAFRVADLARKTIRGIPMPRR